MSKVKKKYTFYSKEDKLDFVKLVLSGKYTQDSIAKENGMSGGMLSTWVRKYREGGIEALENEKRIGNPSVGLMRLNNPTESQKLQLENMLLRIENERLKKGYTTKEAIAAKQRK